MNYAKSDTITSNKVLNLVYQYTADLEYHTEYKGGPYTQSDNPTSIDFHFQQYGVYLETLGSFALNAEFFEWYSYMADLQFRPFKVSPYTQWVIWARPEEGGSDFDINIYASTWLELLTLKTEITENEKVCKVSFYDYVKDTEDNLLPDFNDPTDCDYNEDYESNYYDAYWQYDTGAKLLDNSSWLGERAIYNFWILN